MWHIYIYAFRRILSPFSVPAGTCTAKQQVEIFNESYSFRNMFKASTVNDPDFTSIWFLGVDAFCPLAIMPSTLMTETKVLKIKFRTQKMSSSLALVYQFSWKHTQDISYKSFHPNIEKVSLSKQIMTWMLILNVWTSLCGVVKLVCYCRHTV